MEWETLKPKILDLLSEGKTQKDVREEISRNGPSITLVTQTHSYLFLRTDFLHRKTQLEYQLYKWRWRTNLSERAWLYVRHKKQKRDLNKKKTAVYLLHEHRKILIAEDKVIKETKRHVRPTLLPEPGGKFNP